jgi:hypothetical protein
VITGCTDVGENGRERSRTVNKKPFMMPVALQGRLAGKGVQTASALVIYSAISVIFFGMSIIHHPSQTYIGGGADPTVYMWALAWWPHAIANHLNLFITRLLWSPTGYNLVWATSIPGPSIVFYPVTCLFGPVVSYNILCLICPSAAAFCAFLLCRYICGRFWPALLGGYVFGFSPYVLSQMLGHVVEMFIFPVPLVGYLVLMRMDKKLSQYGFTSFLVIILLFHFLSSSEVFATTTMFGALTMVMSYVIFGSESRYNIIGIAKEIASAYLLLAVLLAPYLYYVFAQGLPNAFYPATAYSNDVLTFLVPPPVVFVGEHPLSSITRHFLETASWWEEAGYLGPALWLILCFFAWSYWRTEAGKLLVLSFTLIAVMSLGPTLHFAGRALAPMPWWLFNQLPLIDQALPGRFGMYLFLVAGLAAAIYLSGVTIPAWRRALLGSFCVLFIAPRFTIWQRTGRVPELLGTPGLTKIETPSFFRFGEYKRYLARNDNVLILPQNRSSNCLLWQAKTRFYFRIAAVRIGPVAPAEFLRWPVLSTFDSGDEIMDFPEQLNAFLGAHQVKAIIVDPSDHGPWARLISESGLRPLEIGGILFYKVPPTVLASFRTATAHQMAEKEAAISFAALVSAANRYLDEGFPLAKLNPWEAQRLKLLALPQSDTGPVSADPQWWQNLWLGPWGSMVGVGILGDYEDLRPLVQHYGPDAADIFFPFPLKLTDGPKQGVAQLLIVFTRQGIKRAASEAQDADERHDTRPRSHL